MFDRPHHQRIAKAAPAAKAIYYYKLNIAGDTAIVLSPSNTQTSNPIK